MPEQLASLTILGCSPAWQDAGGACSSYLVESGDTHVLLDCGNGAFARLRELRDYASIDAIVISHTHGDHVLDLLPFAYALLYSPRALAGKLRRPRLLLPPGAADRLREIFDLIDRAELLDLAFRVEHYDAGSEVTIGPLALRFAAVPHFVPTHAISVTTSAGGRLVYGADHKPCAAIVDFAKGADLALLEATISVPEEGVRGHMTATEAAEAAAAAGVERLLLTHIPDELPREHLVGLAQRVFARSQLAVSGDVHRF